MKTQAADKVAALLYEWEERQQHGEAVTPEALCQDTPELAPALQQEISVLQKVNELLYLTPRETPGALGPETLPLEARVDPEQVSRTYHSPGLEPGVPRIGNYQILEKLGHGGMGIVYKAYDPHLDRIVAIKVLRRGDQSKNHQYLERFRREGRLLAKLNHDHIMKIHAAGVHEEQPYLVMSYYPKGALSKQQSRFRAPAAAARLMAQVARAVHAAHQQNILHRDLKPSNILLDEQDGAIVSDFGLARLADEREELPESIRCGEVDYQLPLTVAGTCIGTPPYMAPEQFQRGQVSKSVDIWALGIMLYELLAGTRPFESITTKELAKEVSAGLPALPAPLKQHMPAALHKILRKCLEPDLAKRYQSAAQVADDLEATLSSKSRRWMLAAGVLLLLGGGFEVGRVWKQETDKKKLDTQFVSQCKLLREELQSRKEIDLLDEHHVPKAYRWTLGDPFFRLKKNASDHLLLKTTNLTLLELMDKLDSNSFTIQAKFAYTAVQTTNDGEFRGLGGIVFSHEVFHSQDVENSIQYAVTVNPPDKSNQTTITLALLTFPHDSSSAIGIRPLSTSRIESTTDVFDISIRCKNDDITVSCNTVPVIQAQKGSIQSSLNNTERSNSPIGLLLKDSLKENGRSHLMPYSQSGIGIVGYRTWIKLSEFRVLYH